MKLNRILAGLLLAAAVGTACGGVAAGSATTPSPPAPMVKYRNTLGSLTAAGPIDLVQSILDFGPGAASVVHTHTAPNLATVLQGVITVKIPSGDKMATAGETLVEPLNQPVQAFNTGTGEAMVAGAFPVPHGDKPTVPVAGQPAPATPNKTLYTLTLNSANVNGGYGIVQQVLDFAPGSQTPRHRHGGPGVITVIQGQITLSRDGAGQTYDTGSSFFELPGQTLQAVNRGGIDAIVVASYLLPDGAQLTTNV